MAVDIAGSTILLPVITKVENQDVHGRNWGTEIVQLTIGTNTGTSYTLNTSTTSWPAATSATGPLHITTPIFVTLDGMDDAGLGTTVAYSAGQVVITWATAPAGSAVKIRVKIEGWV